MQKNNVKWLVASLSGMVVILSGCSEFNGLRTHLYNGEPVAPNEEAIAIYETSRESVGV